MPVGDIFVLSLIVFCVALLASLEIRSRRRMRAATNGDFIQLPVETASVRQQLTSPLCPGGRTCEGEGHEGFVALKRA
jgi:hypothetical protein